MNFYIWKNALVASLFLFGWFALILVEYLASYSGGWIQILYLIGIPVTYIVFWLINTPLFHRHSALLRFTLSGIVATVFMGLLLFTAVTSTIWVKQQLN